MNSPATNLASAPAQSPSSLDAAHPWYHSEIEPKDVSLEMFDLLENYSRLAPDRILPHVTELRERAFKVHPYPCIGQLRFLNLALSSHPLYAEILSRLKTQSFTLLDIGCCVGQDLRKLAHDGAPSALLYGLDIEPLFIDLGFDLFQDKTRTQSTFVIGDLFASDTEWSAPLDGKIDIIYASSLFHLFSYPDQLVIGKRMVSFLRPVPGSMVVGRHVGSTMPGEYPALKGTSFRHDVASFTKLWNDVGAETGTKWKVEAQLDMVDIAGRNNNTTQSWSEPNMRRLLFTVFRE